VATDIWQLRLPLPWDEVPHVNAYLIEDASGCLLVDCGAGGHPSSRRALTDAFTAAGHELGEVHTLVVTHAHSDHVGLAEWVIAESGCTFLMHPDTAHFYEGTREPERIAQARRRRARQEGVADADLDRFADTSEETAGVLAAVEPHRPLRDGDLVMPGHWEVLATPGHAPSHVCLLQRERCIAILADLLTPSFAPWFDYGYSKDPVAEFLASLDLLERAAPFELALPGHGRPIEDVPASIVAHREGVERRLTATLDAVAAGPTGAHELTGRVFGPSQPPLDVWRMTEVASYLRHLRLRGDVVRDESADRRFVYRLAN
jgi:glyoxylase-like metal-dependent hydrolase (beta-lactamase superfamily II)